jgi:hypothetical protein
MRFSALSIGSCASSPLLVELRDRVHQRGPAGLDLLDDPLQGGRDLLGVFDGAFGVPAQRAGETRKIRRRVIDGLPDRGVLHRTPPVLRDADLVLPIVV